MTSVPLGAGSATGVTTAGGGGSERGLRVPTRGLRVLGVAACAATYLLIVAGGVVRVSGSGLGCGVKGQDWPLCHGRLVPPADLATVIEFSHRMLATLSTCLVVAFAVVAWSRYRHLRRVTLPAISAAVVTDPARARAVRRLTWAVGATYLLVLSGALVVANGAGWACAGWPLCGGHGFQLEGGSYATYNLFHRGVAGAVGVLLALAVHGILRTHRGVRPVRIASFCVMVLLLAQVLAGAVLVELRLRSATRGIHLALASALWAATAVLAMLVRPGTLRSEAPSSPPARADVAPAPAEALAR
jgi:heme A synthase